MARYSQTANGPPPDPAGIGSARALTVSEVIARIAPDGQARARQDSEHLVQFYEEEPFLLDSVCTFIGDGLRSGAAGVVIATRAHLDELEQRWQAGGLDLAAARARGQYVPLEAAQTLAKLMVRGTPSQQRFADIVGAAVAAAASRYPRVLAFGEMVALLAEEGRHAAALRLERLWNDLGRRHPFTLLCAYALKSFSAHTHGPRFLSVCAAHSRVIPAESYATLASAAERLQTISSLQQKAHALERQIKERERAEAALREADRRKDEFLATLAHELRNPLAPIRNATEIMRLADGNHEAVAAARALIERQLAHLVRLIDDLLDVSRITQGRLELRRQQVDLRSVLQMALETSRPLIEGKRHQLYVTSPPEPLIVDGDATRLAQVLSNLLNNSAIYSKPAGSIRVTLSREARAAIVTVTDQGIGIPHDTLPRVFDLFARLHPHFEAARDGLGIGLTLAKRLVDLHGGSVEAHSEGENRGSTFIVRLPLVGHVAGELPSSTASRPGSKPASSRRVLIADDNKDAATSLAMILQLDGHVVQTAGDGTEALEIAAQFHPDVVLLDLGMPRLNGYETVKRARQQPWAGGVMIVALTGWGQPEDQRRVQEAGFDHHLVKPCSLDALRALLARVGQRARARKRRQ